MVIGDIYYRSLFESSSKGSIIPDTKSGKICNVNPQSTGVPEISEEEIPERDPGTFGFFKRIYLNHKIFLELFQIEIVHYNILRLKTFYGLPLQVYLTANSCKTLSNS
jgi:hypothetical protein